MGKFNLLDEPWISVLIKESGMKKEVSMLEFFHNADSYQIPSGRGTNCFFSV